MLVTLHVNKLTSVLSFALPLLFVCAKSCSFCTDPLSFSGEALLHRFLATGDNQNRSPLDESKLVLSRSLSVARSVNLARLPVGLELSLGSKGGCSFALLEKMAFGSYILYTKRLF